MACSAMGFVPQTPPFSSFLSEYYALGLLWEPHVEGGGNTGVKKPGSLNDHLGYNHLTKTNPPWTVMERKQVSIY